MTDPAQEQRFDPPSGVREKMTSDAPQVKLEHNRLAALTDWFVAALLFALLYTDALHGDIERGAALTGLLAIAGVAGFLRSKGQSGAGAALFIAKPLVNLLGAGIVGGTRWVMVFIVIAFGIGCAGVDKQIDTARDATKAVGLALQDGRPRMQAYCVDPKVPPPECDWLLPLFSDVLAGYTVINDSLGALP